MSFVICLLRACGLHSDPSGDVGGVEWCAPQHGARPAHACAVAYLGWGVILLPLALSLAACLVVASGTVAEMQTISVLSLDFKSPPSFLLLLSPLGPHQGKRRSCSSAGPREETSSEEQCCPVISLQDQPGPVATDACKDMQETHWVKTSLGTLPSELPPWESSASWAKGILTWANIILSWWGVASGSRPVCDWLSPKNQEN